MNQDHPLCTESASKEPAGCYLVILGVIVVLAIFSFCLAIQELSWMAIFYHISLVVMPNAVEMICCIRKGLIGKKRTML
jgi:hypothetical protein